MPARVTITTTTADATQLLRNYWQGRLLEILENKLMASDLPGQQVIPSNSGTAIEFRRINAFAKQVAGVSQFLGYMTVGDLKGQTFVVDSLVYSLELLTNALRLTR